MARLGKRYIAPVLITVVGIGWFLNVQGMIPRVDWVWTSALAAVGILTLCVGGLDKLTAVVGPFLILSSICSVLRQTGRLSVEKEVPILTIVLGLLLLVVQIAQLPSSKILEKNDKQP